MRLFSIDTYGGVISAIKNMHLFEADTYNYLTFGCNRRIKKMHKV